VPLRAKAGSEIQHQNLRKFEKQVEKCSQQHQIKLNIGTTSKKFQDNFRIAKSAKRTNRANEEGQDITTTFETSKSVKNNHKKHTGHPPTSEKKSRVHQHRIKNQTVDKSHHIRKTEIATWLTFTASKQAHWHQKSHQKVEKTFKRSSSATKNFTPKFTSENQDIWNVENESSATKTHIQQANRARKNTQKELSGIQPQQAQQKTNQHFRESFSSSLSHQSMIRNNESGWNQQSSENFANLQASIRTSSGRNHIELRKKHMQNQLRQLKEHCYRHENSPPVGIRPNNK
jgi:hypothetical protein